MAKLTMLFVDGATENVDPYPPAAHLGVRYAPSASRFRASARVLRPLLRNRLSGHRPHPGHPRGLPAHHSMNLKLEPLRHARQGDRDARLIGQEVTPTSVFEVAKPYARGLAERFHLRALSRRHRRSRRGSLRRDALSGRRHPRAAPRRHVQVRTRTPGSTRSTTTSTRPRTASRWRSSSSADCSGRR